MRISVGTHPHLAGKCRISLDGRDVTNDCRMADDESGEVELLMRRMGQPYTTRDGLATKTLRGHVVIEVDL